ncbi:MAG: hypothetical protein R3264_02095, partial [Anaerolineae bacterium]|nr:hypothetical protein [Anaerolineae bacterium]
MPTLPELLSQVRFITQESVVLALFATAAIILLVRDWRVLIISLLAQYIFAGLILSRLVRPDIAAVKVMIGVFISLILFLSMRQISAKFSNSTGLDFTTLQRPDSFLRWWHHHRLRLRQLLL